MKKSLVSFVAAFALFGATVASLPAQAGAQVYGYAPAYQYQQGFGYASAPVYATACTNLTSDLSYGSRASQVRALQTFLVAQNIPGGGAWMITGYFGRATQAAVSAFQQQQGFAATGFVDVTTRAAIYRVSCGGNMSGFNYGYSNPVYPIYATTPTYISPTYPTYNINTNTYCNNYNYTGATWYNSYPCINPVQITSLSTTSGAPGTAVTIYGSGFDTNNNNVNFGGNTLTNISSYNGTSLVFTVPSYVSNTSVQVNVVSSHGVSNSLTFTVSANNGGCTTYPYNSNCCNGYNNYNYGYNYNYNCGQTLAPTITSVNSPTSLSTGAQGTWTITFNNPISPSSSQYVTTSVNWGDTGNGYVNAAAPQTSYVQGTQTQTFTHSYYSAGTYTVTFTVTNNSGQSNTSSATVYVSGATGGSISLNSISQTSGRVGTQVTLYGSGFSAQDNIVHFGTGGLRYVPSNGSTISFTIPYNVSPCDLIGLGCGAPVQQVLPGTYTVYVTNGNGTSNPVNFTVTY